MEDSANEHVYHAETWLLTKKMMRERAHRLSFTIPIFEPLPSQYYIRCAPPAALLLLLLLGNLSVLGSLRAPLRGLRGQCLVVPFTFFH